MTISSFLRGLVATAFLLLPATALGAEKAPPSSAASQSAAAGTAKARALMKARRYEDALVVLRPLARGRTVQANVLFLTGLAAVEASQKPDLSEDARDALLDEAIDALRTILIGRPNLMRVRLELGRAFFLKGEDTLARLHFEQVLAGSPPAPVVLNVNRFLSRMRARKRWSLRVGMTLAPDSNIGAGSDERIIVSG